MVANGLELFQTVRGFPFVLFLCSPFHVTCVFSWRRGAVRAARHFARSIFLYPRVRGCVTQAIPFLGDVLSAAAAAVTATAARVKKKKKTGQKRRQTLQRRAR